MAINAVNGVTASTSTAIMGRTGLTAINGQSLSSGGGGGSLQFDRSGSFDIINDFGYYTWLGNIFTPTPSFTCTSAKVRMSVNGTVAAGTLQAKIYTNNSGNPGTLVGTASATVDRTTIVGGDVEVDFTGISASLTGSTTYWMIVEASATDGGSSNSVRWIGTTNGSDGIRGSQAGSSWDNLGTGDLNFKLYGT